MKTADYYTANWCGPCKTFKPIILELVGEGYNITLHDIDTERDLALTNRIQSVPTLVISENGEEVDRLVGVHTKQSVISKLS